jgi:hypothetical protein
MEESDMQYGHARNFKPEFGHKFLPLRLLKEKTVIAYLHYM